MSINTEELKRLNPIEDIVTETKGYELHGRGKWLEPASGTKEGGLVVNADAQLYYWNAQSRGGDVFDWLMVECNMGDFVTVAKWLADRAGIPLELDPITAKKMAANRMRVEVLAECSRFLYKKLMANETALGYCHQRGWDDKTIKAARLGYWDGDKSGLIDHLKYKGIDPNSDGAQAVLGMPSNMLVYSHWHLGRCEYLSCRGVGEKRHYNMPRKYLGDRQVYFNSAVQFSSDAITIVEGQADAISLAQLGVPAVALAGVATSPQIIDTLQRFGRIYIGMDQDEAGAASCIKLGSALGALSFVLQWPTPAKDANDWLLNGATSDEFTNLISNSAPFIVHLAAQVGKFAPHAPERDKTINDALKMAATLHPVKLSQLRGELKEQLQFKTLTDFDRSLKAIKADMAAAANEEEKRRRVDDPADDDELTQLLKDQPADHEGHAHCVGSVYPHQHAFVPEWGHLIFDGQMWTSTNAEHTLERRITEILRRRHQLAREEENDRLLSATGANHGQVVGTKKQFESMIVCSPDDFDGHPHHLNVANGVLDLRTGELIDPSPDRRFSYVLDTPYLPDADDSEWLSFLYNGVHVEGMEQETQNLVNWLQEVCGYILTGHTFEDKFFYLFGPSRSGKGTFANTFLTLLGRPLGNSVNISTFTADRGQDTQNFDLAPLKPARLVVASESDAHKRLNTTNLKALTGGDYIYAAYKGRDHFSYLPQFKIVMASNFPLNMNADDTAAWARACVINFPKSHVGKEDRGLKKRLASSEALPGVLAWAVEGAKRWYARGHLPPAPSLVQTMTESHRSDQDMVAIFLDEEAEIASPKENDVFTPTELISEYYQAWCKANRVAQKGRANLSGSLESKGYERKKRRHWKYDNPRFGYCGIRFKADMAAKEASEQMKLGVE